MQESDFKNEKVPLTISLTRELREQIKRDARAKGFKDTSDYAVTLLLNGMEAERQDRPRTA